VIESDPALSLKILKIANSPLVGSSGRVGSLTRATVMLGFRTVASLTLGLSLLSEGRKGSCTAFDYDGFWSQSLARAVTACQLAKAHRMFAPDEAFTCALLSQIGRLAFASAYPERYTEVLHAIADDTGGLGRLETEVFGIDHHELTAEIMSDWHLPELFVLAVRHQDQPKQQTAPRVSRVDAFTRLLHLSGLIAAAMTDSVLQCESLSRINEEAQRLGIDIHALHGVFESLGDRWRQAGQIFSIPTGDTPSLAEIDSSMTDRRSQLACAPGVNR